MLQAQIFIDADELIEGQPLNEFILQILIKMGIRGATVLDAKSGFGKNHKLKRPYALFSFDDTPLLITFIDEVEKVNLALMELRKLYTGGFITTHTVDQW